jgi:hypothetical protein
MLYTRPKFTCPTSNNTSQVQWDYTFLSKEEFITKWGEKLYAATKDASGSTTTD